MMKHIRRFLTLTLCLLLAATPALSQGMGMHFSLRATVHPEAFSAVHRELLTGLAQLLEAIVVEGDFVLSGESFTLDATVRTGSGRNACDTTFAIRGIPSHWSVRSSLLGETQLMVNCASLLPFGQKARNYLGLPLDTAMLLVPYTHENAIASVMALLAPLFPEEDGKINFSREEMDAIISEIARLCDEDPALNRYLEATGLYRTAKRYCQGYFSIPAFLLPSLTVKRSGNELTWTSGMFTLLSIREKNGTTTAEFTLPTLAKAKLECKADGRMLTGSATIDLDSLQLTASFALPARLTGDAATMQLTLDATSPILPDGGVHLRLTGETQGNTVTVRLLDPQTSQPRVTISGSLVPAVAPQLPAWSPADFTGFDILSANSDSLRTLIREVKWPLMQGAFALIVAAPAPAVQTLMDYAESIGILDMITDALSGGSGY